MMARPRPLVPLVEVARHHLLADRRRDAGAGVLDVEAVGERADGTEQSGLAYSTTFRKRFSNSCSRRRRSPCSVRGPSTASVAFAVGTLPHASVATASSPTGSTVVSSPLWPNSKGRLGEFGDAGGGAADAVDQFGVVEVLGDEFGVPVGGLDRVAEVVSQGLEDRLQLSLPGRGLTFRQFPLGDVDVTDGQVRLAVVDETRRVYHVPPLFVGGVTRVLQPEPLDPPDLETH